MIYQKSTAKQIISDSEELKEIVTNTISQMAEIVGKTLGPGGNPVLIERDGLSPLITKDGVTVAKSLGLHQAERNVIIESAKEICTNTAKEAGDGTTTAIVLADAIVKYGSEFIKKHPKYNAQKLVSELNTAYKTVIVPYLKDNAIQAETEDQLVSVAKVSANGDEEIANAVVEAVTSAGDDGTVLLEEGQGETSVETIDGFVVTSGLKELGQIGPAFMNDEAGQQIKMDNALIFLYDGSLTDLQAVGAIQDEIEGTALYGKPIMVFAHEFSDLVLDRLAKTTKGGIITAPIKTPRAGYANSRSILLKDIAAYTGATVYNPSNIEEFDSDGLGDVASAKVNMFETFVVGTPDPALIESRVNELKSIIEATKTEYDRMFLRASISKLTGGVSTIWVGGNSELEVREKKARVEDAVEAVRSAIAEGIITGGCSVHLKLTQLLRSNENYKESWDILCQALSRPLELLLSNCGEDFNSIYPSLMKSIEKSKELPSLVFDASEHKLVDPFKAGIIEPAKVCRVSIGNALSVATLLMTLGGVVCVPRDSGLEHSLAMGKQAFNQMMETQGE